MLLTRAEELFIYDGVNLLWKVDKARAKKGDLAGYITAQGYRTVGVDGAYYGVHRVIWLLVNGAMPECEVDHINGIRLDNRICNLRSVSWSTNAANKQILCNNTSGHMGVSQSPSGKWIVHIYNMHIGTYSQLARAIEVRKQAEVHFGFHENHGRAA